MSKNLKEVLKGLMEKKDRSEACLKKAKDLVMEYNAELTEYHHKVKLVRAEIKKEELAKEEKRIKEEKRKEDENVKKEETSK